MFRHFIIAATLLLSTAVSAQQPKSNGDKPFVLGLVHEMDSKVLGEKRVLNIYLPEGYDANDTIHYPVIYLLDGSADEDFIHIAGLVQYCSFPWVHILSKTIVVGIANVDRKRDFYFPSTFKSDMKLAPTAGSAAKFIEFIANELQPYINKAYKTNTDNTLIGESAGGLLATEILFRQPTLFNKYIIVSPALWWDNASLLNRNPEILQAGFNHRTDVYIGVGKEGLTPSENNHVMEVDANVLADKLRTAKNHTLKVYFDYLPQESHATISHPAVLDAFRMLGKGE